MALMAKVTMPPLPDQQVDVVISVQMASMAVGSRPMRRGPSPRSTMTLVASDASSAPVMASPQPTAPSPVSMRTSVTQRSLSALLGSG